MKTFALLAVFLMLTPVCLAKPKETKTPTFAADTSQVPDLQPWGRAAEALCTVWYPKILTVLGSDDGKRDVPPVIKLIFEKDMKGVAYTSGSEIHIASAWVKSHPDDFGMVIHELTHAVQRYPTYDPSWLVEGIADYVRSADFEPALPTPKINFAKANYTDAYKTTASFLIWIEKTHDKDIVKQLSQALSRNQYKESLFKDKTGMTLPDLWTEFSHSQP